MSQIAGIGCYDKQDGFNLIDYHCNVKDIEHLKHSIQIGNLVLPHYCYTLIRFFTPKEVDMIKSGEMNEELSQE